VGGSTVLSVVGLADIIALKSEAEENTLANDQRHGTQYLFERARPHTMMSAITINESVLYSCEK